MKKQKMRILITGGTKGLGLATAKAFATKGAHLLLTYRSDHEQADQTRDAFKQMGIECHTLSLDLSEMGSAKKLWEWAAEFGESLDVYVHNAAATAFKPLIEIKSHHVLKTFNITINSLIEGVPLAIPLMEKEGGSILTVSGMDTIQVVPGHGLLASAKAALEMLTRYYAHELAPKNIRVNGVNPGYLPTESVKKFFGENYEKATQAIANQSPFKRNATLDEVASVLSFLGSTDARWITGQTILVDGGQTTMSLASKLLGSR